ncbi:hypothetical protein G6F29_011149 [Rhizopus arrhizus]|uniref:Uncharacterized protein n=1 Tax=Rhizopus oryzae TaxID=64495 RepID=A0A9P6X0Y5_RHIOR|nr:hypothetical protein G6F23_006455 [Rhizopus arrhizus]KAG0783441.1 hypothetical protein G6F21_010531 [Rhizopus arrhizus]KAG0795963.1 hypothetical protein G6F22_005005 [Rhizopus arrhizus]KAG0806895.1 hypothetical protein G6F20_010767 [Rhizopus arrhizus]KAG0823255.1 hypothetical protein G6F19_010957 [Rhizopus arrhizus]
MSIYGVPEEYMHCFNVFDEIPKKGPNEDDSVPEQAVKKLLDLKSYQVYRQTLENESHSEAEEQSIIVEIQNDFKQSRKKVELLDLVIEEGLSARKAGAIVGIIERTAQNYVKTYKEDEEKRLSGGRKQRRNPTNYIIRPSQTSNSHALTLKKLEAVVSSRTTLGNLQIRRDKILEWKSDENMNWHKNCVFINEAGFNMNIRRNFGRSKRGMPAKAVIPANRGITVSIIDAICEKGVIDLTLRKPKAVQKK